MTELRPVADQLARLATDVGRLRRHLDPQSYSSLVADRIADRVEALDVMLRPTAAERYRELRADGFADAAALQKALDEVDATTRLLRRRLGLEAKA